MHTYKIFAILIFCSWDLFSQDRPTQIAFLGTLHFKQFHNEAIETQNFLSERRQLEFEALAKKLAVFNPNVIYVEREPSYQKDLDSLYKLPLSKTGISEVYQIGFRMARRLNHQTVYGVDHYESISQNLIESGDNYEEFRTALKSFQNLGREITKQFLSGELTIQAFLAEINRKDRIEMSHRLFFNTPAYVTNGRFSREEGLGLIDNRFIGSEFISLFYNRNLKIYSNILNKQSQDKANRILIIVGQTHVGVLQSLFELNTKFEVTDINTFLE